MYIWLRGDTSINVCSMLLMCRFQTILVLRYLSFRSYVYGSLKGRYSLVYYLHTCSNLFGISSGQGSARNFNFSWNFSVLLSLYGHSKI